MVLVWMTAPWQLPSWCQHCFEVGHITHRQDVHGLRRLLEACRLQSMPHSPNQAQVTAYMDLPSALLLQATCPSCWTCCSQ